MTKSVQNNPEQHGDKPIEVNSSFQNSIRL